VQFGSAVRTPDYSGAVTGGFVLHHVGALGGTASRVKPVDAASRATAAFEGVFDLCAARS
jgi:hypothetical protein